MAYIRKTEDEWRLLIDYGHGDGWEIATCETTYKLIITRRKEYRENTPEFPTKIQCKRVQLEAA